MTTHQRAVEVDTVLADIWLQQALADETIRASIDALHCALHDKSEPNRYAYRGRLWATSDDAIELDAKCILDTKVDDRVEVTPHQRLFATYESGGEAHVYRTSNGDWAFRNLEQLGRTRLEYARLRGKAEPLEAEYASDPWPRFFLVTNSNGHVHRSMSCGTCFPSTEYAWLPQLSGLDEAAAVADQGPRLCSVCYPSAPVEWTLGLPSAPRCPGSGLRAAPGYSRYASQPCSVCGKAYPVSRNTGVVRAHKPKVA